mmetsp:Transcript_70527/g.189148  ORF Transcript_70527/g.189148 Transcript_70527/m.189148 type:complete len:235 (-) Transcript_70527:466-1170(-)
MQRIRAQTPRTSFVPEGSWMPDARTPSVPEGSGLTDSGTSFVSERSCPLVRSVLRPLRVEPTVALMLLLRDSSDNSEETDAFACSTEHNLRCTLPETQISHRVAAWTQLMNLLVIWTSKAFIRCSRRAHSSGAMEARSDARRCRLPPSASRLGPARACSPKSADGPPRASRRQVAATKPVPMTTSSRVSTNARPPCQPGDCAGGMSVETVTVSIARMATDTASSRFSSCDFQGQ